MDDLEITITDIRRAGHCARMAKFFRDQGLRDEYAVMLKGGSIPSSKLEATGDPRAIRVVELKRSEAANG